MMARTARIKAAVTNTGTRQVAFSWNLHPQARDVHVAGSFNGWNPVADRMLKRGGVFRIKLNLPPGEYQYKVVVDGEWHNDPAAAGQARNEFGGMNSVVRV